MTKRETEKEKEREKQNVEKDKRKQGKVKDNQDVPQVRKKAWLKWQTGKKRKVRKTWVKTAINEAWQR